jgi:hypothetical protein
MSSPGGSISNDSYYRTTTDIKYQKRLEPLLISGDYQQRYINNGRKTAFDDVLESLLMTFSVVVYVSINMSNHHYSKYRLTKKLYTRHYTVSEMVMPLSK